ncbi:MAG: pilus assembly PilX N-terminal domain-containing protein [Planctomycetota bacterium]
MRRAIAASESRRGAALVLSLILVMIVGSLGAAFLQTTAAGARTQTHSVDQMQAFYAAEAGLAEAFLAVRMGRSGVIASAEEPAFFGESLLWVEALETGDHRVWIRATAVNGLARATLGQIIEPAEPPLGFFAEEDIVVESVLLIDGFDSSERTYEEEVDAVLRDAGESPWQRPSPDHGEPAIVVDPSSPHAEAQRAALEYEGIFGRDHLRHFLENQVEIPERPTCVISVTPFDPRLFLDESAFHRFTETIVPMFDAHTSGSLFPVPDKVEEPRSRRRSRSKGRGLKRLHERVTSARAAADDRLWFNTGKGGLLGSNGDIIFRNARGEPAAVHGAVTPGVSSEVRNVESADVSGPTVPRSLPVELRSVDVPDVVLERPIHHDGPIPRILHPGATGYEALQVGPGSELVVRGPAEIVVGSVSVESGGKLTLDTRDGDVELFVTGHLALANESIIETTAERSTEVTIQAASGDRLTAAPRLDLEASGAFHGTISAPQSIVRVGPDFEVFGSISARRLEIGAGARLHFDDETFNGLLEVPKQESWRIIDLPNVGSLVAAPAPNGQPALAAAHDLSGVELSVQYIDRSGRSHVYTGPESAFDWSDVAAVAGTERKVERPESEPGDDWWNGWGIDDVVRVLQRIETRVERRIDQHRERGSFRGGRDDD